MVRALDGAVSAATPLAPVFIIAHDLVLIVRWDVERICISTGSRLADLYVHLLGFTGVSSIWLSFFAHPGSQLRSWSF